jgi:hypothetical protein
MKNIPGCIICLILFFVIGCQGRPQDSSEKLGIIVVSHGYYRDSWNDLVRETVFKVNSVYPLRLAFMDFVPQQDIQKAIEELKKEGVKRIRIIPFLFCSYSSHIMQILNIFSIHHGYQSPVDNINEGISPVEADLEKEITSGIDFDSLIAEVLLERLKELTLHPDDEVLILFIHGVSSKELNEHEKEKDIILQYIDYFKKHGYNFSEFIPIWGSHQPSWDSLQKIIEEKISQGKPVNILPFLISHYEEVDGVIRKCIEFASKNTGRDSSWVKYQGKGILPHPNCSRWIEKQINNPKWLDREFYKYKSYRSVN